MAINRSRDLTSIDQGRVFLVVGDVRIAEV